MQPIYFDQAATSWPKAPGVSDEMKRYLDDIGANMGRGQSASALDAALATLRLREELCRFFGHNDPECCILTSGATEALNITLHGFLHTSDRVVVTSMEHNSVMRPLRAISADVRVVNPLSPLSMERFEDELRQKPRLACVTHASNVCGYVMPLRAIAALCRTYGVPLAVDAAQTAGHLPINFSALHLSALALPGHKGLLGPQGIGALFLEPSFASRLTPLMQGGTGSRSSSNEQPQELPDRFEAGTRNLPGIYGLAAALRFVSEHRQALADEAQALTRRFLDGIRKNPRIRLLGPIDAGERCAVVALQCCGVDQASVADRLSEEFGIATRCGLHCAPNAHRTLQSFPEGAIRFSFGYGNTPAQVDTALDALSRILS